MVKTGKIGMVLAAGLGTRLRPLTFEIPKPVVPVLGRPLVSFTLEFLSRHGFKEVVINLHRLPGIVKNRINDWGGFKGNLKYVIEPEILGTGGGIRNASSLFGKSGIIVVANSDTIVDFDLDRAISAHRRKKAIMTMVLFPLKNRNYTPIFADDRGNVISIGEPSADSPPYFYPGVSILSPEAVERIPAGKACLIRNLAIPLIKSGEPVHGYITDGKFLEFGTPSDYLENTFKLLEECETGTISRGKFDVVPPVYISNEANISEGARIGPYAVIEGKAEIGEEAVVTRSIVWPGGRVEKGGKATGVIITPHRIVYAERSSS